jgi:diacylglycerol kinase family enzyme
MNSWLIIAGVRLHGRTRRTPTVTATKATAKSASKPMNAIPLEVAQELPDAESIVLSTMATHRPATSAACAAVVTRSIGALARAPSTEAIPNSLIRGDTVNLSIVRALLIINPHATSMTGRDAGLVVRALGAQLELDTKQTQYRGHAGKLAADSAANGYDLVVPFSGDGTVNEVVNGIMRIPDRAARPALAPVPGGGANVFARTLGIPSDAGGAVQRILHAVRAGERRSIGLGLADDRYFTFSAGLGLDAEVIGDMERQRARGRRASVAAYLRTAVHRYYRTDRTRPALALGVPGRPEVRNLFMGVVTNGSPWTYVGNHAVRPAHADFNSGLDLFALRRLRTITTLAALGHMMHSSEGVLPTGRDVVSASALSELNFEATRPIAFHIDGEYLGETKSVSFRFVPDALCVVALRNPVRHYSAYMKSERSAPTIGQQSPRTPSAEGGHRGPGLAPGRYGRFVRPT